MRSICKRFLPLLLLLCALAAPALADVVVSEVMCGNDVWKNEHHDDWVEIMNTGSKTVDISGWHLSDRVNKPEKFTFPAGTKLKGGECVLVYCTDRDEPVKSGGAYYAPFKLSQKGETVLLSDADGNQADLLALPVQYAGVSYGVAADGAVGYLELSTPGKKNAGASFERRTEAPVLSGGGFESAFVQAADTDAVLRYTLDGETPTEKSPVFPKEGLSVTKTAALRVRAFRTGELPSETVSRTVLVDFEQVLPVFCLTTDDKYLFNSKTGALVKGTGSTPNYEKELEYPVHIEYYDETGRLIIDQTGSFTAAGHSARQNAQKSIALYARGIFGQDAFDFNPFPNRDYASYHSLLLRNNSDAFSTRLRDPVISSLAEGQNILYQDALAVEVFINGRYWGQYNLREKINKYFIAQYEGISDEETIDAIDILARTGSDSFVQNGSNADWLELCDFCKKKDLNVPENLQYVLERLDVDSLFTHAAFEMIIGNNDITNVRVYRVPGGKWKYLLFDVEAGFLSLKEGPISNYIKPVSAKIQAFRHEPLNALLNVPEYRDRFLRRFAEMLEDCFQWPEVEAKFAPWEAAILSVFDRQYDRWPYLTRKNWQQNVDAVKYYARVRPKKVIDLLSSRMKLTQAEKEQYFGDTARLLEETNTLP